MPKRPADVSLDLNPAVKAARSHNTLVLWAGLLLRLFGRQRQAALGFRWRTGLLNDLIESVRAWRADSPNAPPLGPADDPPNPSEGPGIINGREVSDDEFDAFLANMFNSPQLVPPSPPDDDYPASPSLSEL